jgi:hypothetical protein
MGCDEVSNSQIFMLGKESTFRINQLYTSFEGKYTLQITEINDSRCPDGVECIWAGEVSLKGEWVDSGTKVPVELYSLTTEQQKVPDGFTMQIVDARPYPKNGVVTKPEDLVITLLIQKK